MIKNFLKDLDKKWKPLGVEPLNLVGSTALFLQASYQRGTKDSDILETDLPSKEVAIALQKLGGKDSCLAKQHHLYLDLLQRSLLFLPTQPIFHIQNKLNTQLKNFLVQALDVTDVAISKLKRFSVHDREDIDYLAQENLIDPINLLTRFKLVLDRWLVAPLVGGVLTSFLMELLIYPCLFL